MFGRARRTGVSAEGQRTAEHLSAVMLEIRSILDCCLGTTEEEISDVTWAGLQERADALDNRVRIMVQAFTPQTPARLREAIMIVASDADFLRVTIAERKIEGIRRHTWHTSW